MQRNCGACCYLWQQHTSSLRSPLRSSLRCSLRFPLRCSLRSSLRSSLRFCCWLMSIGIIHKFPSAATACLSLSLTLALSHSLFLSLSICVCVCEQCWMNSANTQTTPQCAAISHQAGALELQQKGGKRNETNEITKQRRRRRRRRLAARWGEVKWNPNKGDH